MKDFRNNGQLPEWNRDEVWTKIETRLARKKRRRRAFLLWFGASIFVCGLGFYFLKMQATPNQSEAKELLFAEKEKSSSNETIQLPERKKENTKLTESADNQQVTNDSVSFSEKKSVTVLSKKEKGNTQKSINNLAAFAEKSEYQANESYSKLNSDFTKKINSQSEEKTATLRNIEPIKKRDLSPLLEKIKTEKTKNLINPFDKSPLLFSLLKIENQPEKFQNQNVFSIEKQESISQSKTLFFVETSISSGDVKYSGSTELTDVRSETETFRFSSGTTVGLERRFKKNWFIKTGLTFQTFFEKYENTSDSLASGFVQNDTAFIYDLGNGNFFAEAGTREVTQASRRAIIKNNFIYRLSVPISVGYIFKIKKTQINTDLGFRIRAFQKFSGIVSDANRQHLFNKKTINETLYANQFDLGLIAGISIRQPINERNFLGLGLRYEREDIFDVSTADNRSNYQFFGANLGWYRKF